MKKETGFSLMEVVLAIGIIAVIGVFSSTLLTRTYNTSSQSDAISKLKQNGQQALNILSESIRMADGVVCVSSLGPVDGRNNILVIRDGEGKFTKYMFVDPVPQNGAVVTQNGYITKQENLDPDPAGIDIFCASDVTGGTQITDSTPFAGISVSGGKFTQFSGNEGKDTIGIQFYTSPAGKGLDPLIDPLMQTTIKVR